MVQKNQAEVLAPAEVLDLGLDHLAVQEAEIHQVYREGGIENSEESHLVEGRACHLAGLEAERRSAEKGEMACRDRQEGEARLAYRMAEEACLLISEKQRKTDDIVSHTWKPSRKWRWKAARTGRGLQHGICLTCVCVRGSDGVDY